jgi:DHA2 family multidrug resistance protein
MSWHYIFYLNVPPGLLVMAMLAHGLDRKPVDWEVIKRVDLIGILTMAVGLGLLEVVLEEGNREDWFGSSFIVRLTVISVVALVFFVISQLLRRHPWSTCGCCTTRASPWPASPTWCSVWG